MRIYILSLTERKVIDKYTTNHSAIYDFILKEPLVRSLSGSDQLCQIFEMISQHFSECAILTITHSRIWFGFIRIFIPNPGEIIEAISYYSFNISETLLFLWVYHSSGYKAAK